MAKAQTKRTGGFDLPVSSFADIAFLLIIFFILATTLQKTMGVMTDLPAGEKSEQKQDTSTTIKLNEGRIFLNDEATDLAGLRTALDALDLASKADDQRTVVLEASGRVSWQLYYDVMTAVAKAGGIVAILREEEGASADAAGGGQ